MSLTFSLFSKRIGEACVTGSPIWISSRTANPIPEVALMTIDPRPDALSGYPVIVTLPVQWGDMDAFGHVNNTVPIRWFESSRIAYLERANLAHLMQATELGPILAAVNCNFRRQILYPDTVQIGARVSRMGRSSIIIQHAVYSEKQQCLAADGESTVVIFDYNAQRPVRVPQDVRDCLESIEGPVT